MTNSYFRHLIGCNAFPWQLLYALTLHGIEMYLSWTFPVWMAEVGKYNVKKWTEKGVEGEQELERFMLQAAIRILQRCELHRSQVLHFVLAQSIE